MCWETRELPNVDNMRLRIMRRVMEAGLSGFTEGCVDVMQQAVEAHVKNILHNYVLRTKFVATTQGVRHTGFVAEALAGALDTAPVPPPAVNGTAVEPTVRHVIRLRDLTATLEMTPYLLGEARLHLDKMASTL